MNLKRALARVTTSVVVFALCAELLGLAAYYADTGALFYSHRKTYPELLPTPQSAVQWGISAVALGFLLLAVGVGASIHWTSRTRGRYFATNSSDEITARHAMR